MIGDYLRTFFYLLDFSDEDSSDCEPEVDDTEENLPLTSRDTNDPDLSKGTTALTFCTKESVPKPLHIRYTKYVY